MDAPDENREAIVEYLASVKRFDPSADGNWRLMPVPGVKLRFVSGAGGIVHLATSVRSSWSRTTAMGRRCTN
jgi:2',3'-cyclic-nucleotide 2'-phosphodiesterase / 3'-nucleotidase